MVRARWYYGMLGVILGSGMAFSAVIFSDDFSDCAQTNLNWIAPVPSATTTTTCGSGVYRITNTSPTYSGMIFHEFPSPKPAVFTISAKISVASGSRAAGIWVCYNKVDNSGYLFQLNPSTNQSLQFNKYRANAQLDSSFVVQNNMVASGANVLKISKKNDSITLWCNDAYVTAFVDRSPLASGDLTLLIATSSAVDFDDIVVTDQWTPPPAPIHGFIDQFSNNIMDPIWQDISQDNQKGESDGYLKIATTTTGTAFSDYYVRVDGFGLDTFVTRVAVMHRSGNKVNLYGIFYMGAPVNTVVPMAYFSITGSKQYDAYIDSIRPTVSSFIRGAAYDTTYYTDTIEVIKKRNSPYRMYVNGNLLDSIPESRITFPIIGAGINIDNGMSVWVDFFQHSADREYSQVIVKEGARRQTAPVVFTPYKSGLLFDPMGRVIRIGEINSRNRAVVPGYYITPDGTKGLIINKR